MISASSESLTSEPCESSLDPQDWEQFRTLAHQALDDAISSLQNVRQRPVWQPVPPAVRNHLTEDVPAEGIGLEQTYEQCCEWIFPYPTGNIHPRFWGWVHGTGTATGIISELLTAAMNSNCGGRDHGALYVERAVIEWCKQIFGFPDDASGLLVSGTSMANLIALTVARNSKSDANIRQSGVLSSQRRMVAYASAEVHESVAKAMEILRLGNQALRRIAVTPDFRIDLDHLRRTIAADRENGTQPFCVIASAGTVNTGAVDDLQSVADICRSNDLWFHVDGAFGALGVLSPEVLPLLKGIEQADSIAFDFHKWMYVQYDCGCVLVRDGNRHGDAFSMRPNYLQRLDRGLAGGGAWFCEYGPELSRSFRALKVWFMLKQYGTKELGRMIAQNCYQARYLAAGIKDLPDLELLVEPILNIVCFRFIDPALTNEQTDHLNRTIVAELQEKGIAAPSTTTVNGKLAIRVAITNHRSRREDFSLLLEQVVQLGKQPLVAA
jgi:aromatic-L-amino-acid decarboxylase